MSEGIERTGPRILIVDDNAELAENIAEILAFEGFASEVAVTAEEAIPRALAADFAFLLTDFRLPGLNGAELIARVRRARSEVRCVVMSGHTNEDTVGRVRGAGAHFLPKPLNFGALMRWLRGVDPPG